MKRKVLNLYYVSVLSIVLLVVSFACRKEHMTLTTTTDVNITGYLERESSNFSLFLQMLDRSKTSGYLGAYGSYTVFAPTNDAINSWLSKTGRTSLADVSDSEINTIVKFHLIKDTLSTSTFTDGKLRTKTFYGQYLLMGATNINGTSYYTVNKQANVLQTNIRVGNGIIHVIDNVLVPAQKTVARTIFEIDSLSGNNYSIFLAALKATGFYDSLNVLNNKDTTKLFQTVILQPNSAFPSDIKSYTDLYNKYSTLKSPTNPKDSLWLFVAYHILPGANFLADFSSTGSFNTLAAPEVITSTLSGETLLINDFDFNGIHEPGVPLNRQRGDISAANGVVQEAAGHYRIVVRSPSPVYYDVAEQPELKAMGAVWRVPGKEISIGSNNSNTLVKGISYNNASASQNSLYSVFGTTDVTNYTAGNDCLKFALGTSTARSMWIEFTTPMIVKGTYKIWVCQRYMSSKYPYIQATVDAGTADEQVLPNILNVNAQLSSYGVSTTATNANDLLYAAGVKRYSYEQPTSRNEWYGRYMGTVKITTTNKHTIRLTRVGGNGEQTPNFWLDMIQFIPVDMDQYHMRHDRSGVIHYVP